MKIVTFNVRFNNPKDGEFSFEHRKEEIIRRIQAEKPDVIGFQEIRDEMQAWMEEQLPEYSWVGHGRTAQLDGEHCPVVYRKDKFKLRNFQCFWLSDTPNVPGSKYEGQGYHPRICNMLLLYSMEDKKTICVFNTHLCNISADARKKSMELMLAKGDEFLAGEKMPIFIMGDFNAEPGWPELAAMEERADYKDVTSHIPYTFHGFFKLPEEKIDYIYVNDMVKVISCNTWESEEGHICLSDHYPIGLICEIL